jgi:hypothetical protein
MTGYDLSRIYDRLKILETSNSVLIQKINELESNHSEQSAWKCAECGKHESLQTEKQNGSPQVSILQVGIAPHVVKIKT